MSAPRRWLGTLGLACAVAGASTQLGACASIANVNDVKLADAGDATSQALSPDGGFDAPAVELPAPAGNRDAGCDCDISEGLGCCMAQGGGNAVCTAAADCKGGMFAACEKYDPDTESHCCWNNGTGAGSFTAFAAACGSRPTACTRDEECQGGAKCETSTCGALTIGTCGGPKPSCP